MYTLKAVRTSCSTLDWDMPASGYRKKAAMVEALLGAGTDHMVMSQALATASTLGNIL